MGANPTHRVGGLFYFSTMSACVSRSFVKPFVTHENPIVSISAIFCLLNTIILFYYRFMSHESPDKEASSEPAASVSKNIASELHRFLEYVVELKKESDRAAVILGAAQLDNLLEQILLKVLLPNPQSKDDLFNGNGPLITFSAKINLTYRLGIIDAPLTRNLHLIRKIRNDFAHASGACKLSSGEHKDRVMELNTTVRNHSMYEGLYESFKDQVEAIRIDFFIVLGIQITALQTAIINSPPVYSNYPILFNPDLSIPSE